MEENETTYPYPIPEFIDSLNQMQERYQNEEQAYSVLAGLLEACHAIVEHANACWRERRFLAQDEPELPTYHALNYALSRLVPVLLKGVIGGWSELLMYIENHADYPWYDPNEAYPILPPRLGTPQREAWECSMDEMLVAEGPLPEIAEVM